MFCSRRHSPLLVVALLLLAALVPASACSFVVSNSNLTAQHGPEVLALANWWQRWRGPDATNMRGVHGWSFLHNLLSMTGAFTLQPFVSASNDVAIVFNGEVYNYRQLGRTLAGSADAYSSDGLALLPAYERWGEHFVEHLEGEFAIVLVDFRTQRVLLSTDAFSTKPLWYAQWREPGPLGQHRFLAASYESALRHLGAPDGTRKMADANQAVVLAFPPAQAAAGGGGGGGGFARVRSFPLVRWDLRQHKNSTRDWVAAFRRAVAVRTRGIKHRAFIGLSSGYDSGAIMLALQLRRTPFLAYAISGSEDARVVDARARFCASTARVERVNATRAEFEAQHGWLRAHCEPYAYEMEARRGEAVWDDEAATGMSLVLRRVRALGGLIYLSGSGADEIISDYARGGRKIYPHSCFGGVFPADLGEKGFFPWCSFYGGSQRAFLMKEELTSGAHGVEGRYPFLDPAVVQEFLWLSADVKNSEYKRPVADFLRAHSFANTWNQKVGFTASRNLP